jgi:hypothetical protein
MAGMNCDMLFSYSNKKEYIGLLNFRNVIALQVQRVYDATASAPPTATGVPTIATGAYTGIIVNGVDFGSGRILAFSQPTSTDITENGRHLWKQSVSVEIYETGDLSNFGIGVLAGITGWDATLQALEEQFSFDITQDGDYQYVHTANVKCADMVSGVSGYITAQNIASGLLASTPPFGYIDAVHSGFYTSQPGKRIYNETFSIFDGSVNFEERFVIQSRDFVKHNVAFDNGFMNITESITLRHSGVSTVSGALTSNEYSINTRYINAVAASYTRCNSLYGTYAALIESDAYATSLSTQPLQLTKTFDERTQEMSYTIIYTNNPNMSGGYTIDREQTIAESAQGIITASENGTLNAYNQKDPSLLSFLITNVDTEMSGMPLRMGNFYPNINNLKKESENKGVSIRGKKATYNIAYSSDPSLINDGTFLTRSFNISDSMPIRMHTPYLIVGRSTPLVHSPGQTELGNITCTYNTTLVRPTGYSPATPIRIDSALNQLFVLALNQALLTVSAHSPTDTFATKVSYQYDSNLNMEIAVELAYLFPRTTEI